MTGIYKYTNIKNNKVYIGQSTCIEQRKKSHESKAKNSNSSEYNSYFHRAIRKYGIDNFTFEIIEECPISLLDEREKFWIAYYCSNKREQGYNIKEGGASNYLQDYSMNLDKQTVSHIQEDLLNTHLTQQEIANKYSTSQPMISYINAGIYWHNENYKYPLRKKSSYKGIFMEWKCIECGKEISKGATRCQECARLNRKSLFKELKNEQEDFREILKNDIRTMPFTKVGEKYGVSDNAIRKWCDKYNLPRKSTEIKKYTDKEWELL